MIGFVIVSHSKKLADNIIELCNEMKKYDFPVINGSGIEGEHLGSDPMKIKEAIEKIYTPEGVIIIGDIGSSILNSEMAIELLNENCDKDRVKIADTPIVEGTLVAMSINDGKTSLEEILQELSEVKNFNKV